MRLKNGSGSQRVEQRHGVAEVDELATWFEAWTWVSWISRRRSSASSTPYHGGTGARLPAGHRRTISPAGSAPLAKPAHGLAVVSLRRHARGRSTSTAAAEERSGCDRSARARSEIGGPAGRPRDGRRACSSSDGPLTDDGPDRAPTTAPASAPASAAACPASAAPRPRRRTAMPWRSRTSRSTRPTLTVKVGRRSPGRTRAHASHTVTFDTGGVDSGDARGRARRSTTPSTPPGHVPLPLQHPLVDEGHHHRRTRSASGGTRPESRPGSIGPARPARGPLCESAGSGDREERGPRRQVDDRRGRDRGRLEQPEIAGRGPTSGVPWYSSSSWIPHSIAPWSERDSSIVVGRHQSRTTSRPPGSTVAQAERRSAPTGSGSSCSASWK